MLYKLRYLLLPACLSLGPIHCAENPSSVGTQELSQTDNPSDEIKDPVLKKKKKSKAGLIIGGTAAVGVPALAVLTWALWPKSATGTGGGSGSGTGEGSGGAGGSGSGGGSGAIDFNAEFIRLADIMSRGDIATLQVLWNQYSSATRGQMASFITNQYGIPGNLKINLKKNLVIQPLHYAACLMDPKLVAFWVANGSHINGNCKYTYNADSSDYKLRDLTPMDALASRYEVLGSQEEWIAYIKTITLLSLLGGCNVSNRLADTYKQGSECVRVTERNIYNELVDGNQKCHFLFKNFSSGSIERTDLRILSSDQLRASGDAANIYSHLWAEKSAESGGTAVHYLLTTIDQHHMTDEALCDRIALFTAGIREFITTRLGTFYGPSTDRICDTIVKIYLNVKDRNGSHRPLFHAQALPQTRAWLVDHGAVVDDVVISFSPEEVAALG